jgi:hypothetical protein
MPSIGTSPETFATLKPDRPIGLLAGSGTFPFAFAQAAANAGQSVAGVGIEGMASEMLAAYCRPFTMLPLGRIGSAIRFFLRAGVERAVMAGKVEKTVLFRPYRFWRLLPDWRTLHMWFSYATQDRKDDTLLLAVIREFGRDGITFASALDYCPELLVKHGFLTRRKPSHSQWQDVRFGWELAREMGRLDVGQSVMVKDKAVLAIEAIEGTDACIRRAGDLCRKGGFTVVKVAKPQQDMRFDVPTIGRQTIQTMRESGAKVLAIESDKTIILDQVDVIREADRASIAIVALRASEIELRLTA